MTNFLYIHIPFCIKKCNYCSFVSITDISFIAKYIDALLLQIKETYKGETLCGIYIGGGTPSLLNIKYVEKILSFLNFDRDTEITFEVNPNSANQEYFKEIKELGINRLSIGIQSFDDKLLKIIGRTHNVYQALKAFEYARNVGIKNINIDLIYGLPSQTKKQYTETLKQALSLNPEHISLYGLKIEEGCNFYLSIPDNLPDENMQAEMYLLSKKFLEKNNYTHYEISNFCKKGFQSKHNTNYWCGETYYGFGAAAHGYDGIFRYENQDDINQYIKNPLKLKERIKLTKQDKLEETVFLGLRLQEGINIEKINKVYDIDFKKCYDNILNKYISTGHLQETQNGYKLTTKGILLSNYIMSDFIN